MAHNNLGFALDASGDRPGAVAEYREAIRLKPDLPKAHANLGFALEASGDRPGAIAEYREAIRLKPGALRPITTSATPCAPRATCPARSRRIVRRSG